MAKRIAVWVVMVMFFAGTVPAFAKDGGGKGPNPSEKAYEHANDNAKFKRTADVKAKDTEDAAKKADKEARKAKKEAEEKAEKDKKMADKEAKKAEKEAKKKQKDADKEARKSSKNFKK